MATIAILTPSRGTPHPHYVGALEYNVELSHVVLSAVGKPVDVARNELAARVRAMRDRPKYVAWVDDDAYWMRGTLSRLIANLEATTKPYRAVVGGFHGGRNPSDQIHAYVRKGRDYVTISYPSRRIGVHEKPLVIPCDVIGSHMLVHRTELLDRLDVAPFTVFEGSDYGEDFAFAERVRSIGGSFYADVSLPIFHADGEYLYLPESPAMAMAAGTPRPAVLSDRAGSVRRYGDVVDAARDRWLARNSDDPRHAKTVRDLETAR